jgi:hypothetical protein
MQKMGSRLIAGGFEVEAHIYFDQAPKVTGYGR